MKYEDKESFKSEIEKWLVEEKLNILENILQYNFNLYQPENT